MNYFALRRELCEESLKIFKTKAVSGMSGNSKDSLLGSGCSALGSLLEIPQ